MRGTNAIFNKDHLFSCLLSSNGTLIEANEPCLCFMDAKFNQLPLDPFWEFWPNNPDSASTLKDAIQEGYRGQHSRFEIEHTDAVGNSVHVHFILTPVHDLNKNVSSLEVEFRNIEATQKSLIECKQRFQTVVELSPDCFWEQDENFRFTWISRQIEHLMSGPAESYIGQCRWEFMGSDSEQVNWSDHRAALLRHEPFKNFEYECSNEAGETVWLSTSGHAIFDSKTRFIGYCGTSRNISDQKRSEAVFKEKEQYLSHAINLAGIGIWEWDMVSDQVSWDNKQFELFGIDKVDGLIPLSMVTDSIHPDDREELEKVARKVLAGEMTALEEFRVVHSDGSIRWLLGGSGVVNFNEAKSSARLIGINLDITKIKEIEEALRDSEDQLHTLNQTLVSQIAEFEAEAEHHKKTQSLLAISRRHDSIGQLAGGVAHDFNNLLAVIGGSLELAEFQVTEKETRTLISDALKSVDDGAILTQRLLSYARKKTLSPVTCSASDCVVEAVRLLERTLGEDITITTKIDPDIWKAYIDPGEIKSAIINLAVNARDAMPVGGSLMIEVRNLTLVRQGKELSADSPPPGEYIGIFVSDTGTGMTEEVMQRACEPFFTTKEPGKGAGLGLSSVYGLILDSGGFLKIDSQVDKGSTFRLYLPRASDQAAFSEPTPVVSEQIKTSGEEVILVVEDDPRVRDVTVKRLKYLGYQVIKASTAREAIDILKAGKSVDLVFTDIVMPGGMSGYDLSDWITKNRKEVRVLLTSGYSDPAKHNNTSSTKAVNRLLIKPYSIDLLAQKVREILT